MHVSVTGSVRNWMSSLSNNTLTGSFYVHTGWVYMHVYKGAESDASCCVFFISSTHIKQCVQNIFYSNVICKSLSSSLPPALPSSFRVSCLLCRFSATAWGHPATALPLQKGRSLPGGRWRRTTDTQETRITQGPSLSSGYILSTLPCPLSYEHTSLYIHTECVCTMHRFTHSHTTL